MSIAKKALIAVAALIVVSIVSVTLAYKLIDNSFIERNALKALQDTLQRDVTVDGEFTLSRSLHPNLRTTGVRIASADWDKGNALLEAETIEIGIALLDLLTGNITINNIVFEDAVINIKRNQNGQSNLDFSPDYRGSEEVKQSSGATTGAPVDVIDVKINNFILNYSDLQADYSFVYAIESLLLNPKDAETIKIIANSHYDAQPVKLESEMCRVRHLLQGENCAIKATLNTQPFISDIQGTINIANTGMLNLTINSQADNINDLVFVHDISPVLPDTDKIKIETQINGAFEQISLKDLDATIELENTTLQAKGNVSSINALTGIDIALEASTREPTWLDDYQDVLSSELIKDFRLNAFVRGNNGALALNDMNAELELPDTRVNTNGNITLQPDLLMQLNLLAEGKQPLWLDTLQQAINAKEIDQFKLQAQIDNAQDTYNINQLSAEININDSTTRADGNINITKENNISLDLAIESSGKSLQDFSALLEQSFPITKNYDLSTQFKYDNDTINLTDLTIVIDETQLEGNSIIELSTPPNVRAEINADVLNIEHLLALAANEDSALQNQQSDLIQDEAADTSLFSDDIIDLEWLSNANTNIVFNVNNLIYKDVNLSNVNTTTVAKNNIATFDVSSLKYGEANVRFNTSINAGNHTYTSKFFTQNFDLGKLLSEATISETLKGKIDASIDLTSTGKTTKQLANNVNGQITTVMTEGSLKDAPIDLLASNLLVELMPGKSNKSNTKVECLFIQFSGENGVFNSDAALLNTENIVMTTTGNIDLTSERLNLLLAPKPKNLELFTLDANIRVAGPLTDPGFSLDKGSLFKKLLKTAATAALGPAALAIPFTNMGDGKTKKCFNDVAEATTKAVEAQQEAERIAREQAEKEKLEKELQEKTLKEPVVEALDP